MYYKKRILLYFKVSSRPLNVGENNLNLLPFFIIFYPFFNYYNKALFIFRILFLINYFFLNLITLL
ncbi:hypothetical protein MAPG_10989 [Magnaporthiopsis poae ATCC 64411]|uniref:Uncharacterized protein n=1 Tax=Magnaporthiopsis poae (strain ATCC 64411 / 73-15) TaxID=644358 RepID=A0A0C4EE24_MAGP6|nr:hypothetical protein MAPG_10989 [Magnaporthiopsis poae ATCC 64411]